MQNVPFCFAFTWPRPCSIPHSVWVGERLAVFKCNGLMAVQMVEMISSSEISSAAECFISDISVFNLEILPCEQKANQFLFHNVFALFSGTGQIKSLDRWTGLSWLFRITRRWHLKLWKCSYFYLNDSPPCPHLLIPISDYCAPVIVGMGWDLLSK